MRSLLARHRPLTAALLRVSLALAFAAPLHAQLPPTPRQFQNATDPLHQSGDKVTVSLLTMGNGEQIWEKFGHSAIWIHDDVTGRDTVFNWGVFNPRVPFFIGHFLQGLMMYQMGADRLDDVLAQYRYLNRNVVSQQLALTAPQKDSLLHLIRINAQPENLIYRYDYFQNNCSTRPRDLLDGVLGGLIHAHSGDLTKTSYRWHAERLMQDNTPLDVGVHIGLGEPSDRPITRWQAMFLPRELHDVLTTLQVPDSTGAPRPLVARETKLYVSTRGAEPSEPPHYGVLLTTIGMIVAVLFLLLGPRAEVGSRGTRIAAAIAFGLWSLIAGLLGVVLSLLWGVTDHVFAHANENLLLFNPLWLLLAVLLPMYFFSMPDSRVARVTKTIVYVIAALCSIALLAHVATLSRQDNLAVVGLVLPPALALAWIMSRWAGGVRRDVSVHAAFTPAAR